MTAKITRLVSTARTGDCVACGFPVSAHFDAGTNRMLGCAVAGGAPPPSRIQPSGPWVDTETGAALAALPTRGAFRMWARRRHLVAKRDGRRLVYARADILRVLRDRPMQVAG